LNAKISRINEETKDFKIILYTTGVLKNTTVVFEINMGVLKIPRGGIKHTIVI
jgi:hypothetical protein